VAIFGREELPLAETTPSQLDEMAAAFTAGKSGE